MSDMSYLTLNEMQLRAIVEQDMKDVELRRRLLLLFDSIGPMRKLAMDRYEYIRNLEREIDHLKDGGK